MNAKLGSSASVWHQKRQDPSIGWRAGNFFPPAGRVSYGRRQQMALTAAALINTRWHHLQPINEDGRILAVSGSFIRVLIWFRIAFFYMFLCGSCLIKSDVVKYDWLHSICILWPPRSQFTCGCTDPIFLSAGPFFLKIKKNTVKCFFKKIKK